MNAAKSDMECEIQIDDLDGLIQIINQYGKIQKIEKGSIVITIGIESAEQLKTLTYEYREAILRAKMQSWLEKEQKQKVENVIVEIKDKVLWELKEFYDKDPIPCTIVYSYCPVTWRWFWSPVQDTTWWQHCTAMVLTAGTMADCRPKDEDVNVLIELAKWNGEKQIVSKPEPCIFCKQRTDHPTKSKVPPSYENFSLKVAISWEDLGCNFQADEDEETEKETGDMLADLIMNKPSRRGRLWKD